MSPFSITLKEFRRQRGLRQNQLAKTLGCEPSYISALENNLKPPTNRALLSRLATALDLDDSEREMLDQSIRDSQSRYTLPSNVPVEVFYLCKKLWAQIDALKPAQVKIIFGALELGTHDTGPSHPAESGLPHEGTAPRPELCCNE